MDNACNGETHTFWGYLRPLSLLQYLPATLASPHRFEIEINYYMWTMNTNYSADLTVVHSSLYIIPT